MHLKYVNKWSGEIKSIFFTTQIVLLQQNFLKNNLQGERIFENLIFNLYT